jgi:hypothetical protein
MPLSGYATRLSHGGGDSSQGTIPAVVDAGEDIAPSWEAIGSELRRRQSETLRAWLASHGQVAVDHLDHALRHVDEGVSNRGLLNKTFFEARKSPELSVLLATYCYAAALETWELALPSDQVQELVEAIQAAVLAAIPEGESPSGRLVRSVVRLAESLVDAMEVENALNCSCPFGMKTAAHKVVKRARVVQRDLADPVPGQDACREFILTRAKIDHVYYEAVVATAEGVEAYIEGGPQATDTLRARIADVERAENNEILQGDVYQSELRVHRLALAALLDAWPRIYVDRAEIIYCYPFAVRSEKPGVQIKAQDLIAAAQPPRRPTQPPWQPWRRTGHTPTIQELSLTDMWAGNAPEEDRFAGIAVLLPTATVATTASTTLDGFAVELRLSHLGNHYLRVQSHMNDKSLHELNQAMRRGTPSMGREVVTCGTGRWDRMSDMARDLIESFVEYLGNNGSGLDALKTVIPQCSEEIIVSARQLSVEGPDGCREEASIDVVTASPGASLLLQPVHGAAVALEQWVRHPVPETVDANLLGDYGFIGDFSFRTANTSFGYFPGRPEFLVLEYEEAAEFVASLPAPLQGWLEDIRAISSLESGKVRHADERKLQSRTILTQARMKLAHFRSSDLCLTAVQRELLDRSFASAGIPKLEQDLEAQFEVANAYLAELSAEQARENDQRQSFIANVLGFTAVFFGLASLATILQLANSGFRASRGGIRGEVLVIGGLALVVLIWVIWLVLSMIVTRQKRRRDAR